MSEVAMWRSRWRCVIKPAYSVSFLLSINIFVWQNVLYFLDAPRTLWAAFNCVSSNSPKSDDQPRYVYPAMLYHACVYALNYSTPKEYSCVIFFKGIFTNIWRPNSTLVKSDSRAYIKYAPFLLMLLPSTIIKNNEASRSLLDICKKHGTARTHIKQ